MSTYCAPLVADLFLFCYEWDFMISLSDDKQAILLTLLTLHSGHYHKTLVLKVPGAREI